MCLEHVLLTLCRFFSAEVTRTGGEKPINKIFTNGAVLCSASCQEKQRKQVTGRQNVTKILVWTVFNLANRRRSGRRPVLRRTVHCVTNTTHESQICGTPTFPRFIKVPFQSRIDIRRFAPDSNAQNRRSLRLCEKNCPTILPIRAGMPPTPTPTPHQSQSVSKMTCLQI